MGGKDSTGMMAMVMGKENTVMVDMVTGKETVRMTVPRRPFLHQPKTQPQIQLELQPRTQPDLQARTPQLVVQLELVFLSQLYNLKEGIPMVVLILQAS